MGSESDQIRCMYCEDLGALACEECLEAERDYQREVQMVEKINAQISQFALALGNAAGVVVRAMSNDEVMAEFAARGSSKKDLQELLEAMKKVAAVFYNTAQPI